MSRPERAVAADNEVQELGRQGPQGAGHLRGLLAGAGRRHRARHGEVRLRQRRDARPHGRRRDGHRQLRGQDPQEEGQSPRHLEQPEGQEVARRHRRGSREQPRVRREADGRRRLRLPRHESDRDADVQRHVRAEDRQRRDLRAASEGAEVHGAPDERVHEDRQEARRPRQPRADDQEGLRREDAGAHALRRRRRRDGRRRDGEVGVLLGQAVVRRRRRQRARHHRPRRGFQGRRRQDRDGRRVRQRHHLLARAVRADARGALRRDGQAVQGHRQSLVHR